MIENDLNVNAGNGNIDKDECLDSAIFPRETNLNKDSNMHTVKELQSDNPFEYGNGYGYLYSRLKWILGNFEISGQLNDELYSLLETIGELRVLGVYNEPYKKYRRALDMFSMKFDPTNRYNENIIGELRYQCYQSSASGRKEIKMIDRCIKEWSKRDREHKLMQSYRGAMSEWLNKNVGVNKIEYQNINKEDLFKEIIEFSKDITSLQQSHILSFLSPTYISEKLFPFMPGQTNNNTTGVFSSGVFGDPLNSDTPKIGGSISSIEILAENNGDEIATNHSECKHNSTKGELALEVAQKSNDNSLNSKCSQNVSVMNWIKNNLNRRQDTTNENSERNTSDADLIHREKTQLSSDKDKIVSQRLSKTSCDIGSEISIPIKLNKEIILNEYFNSYVSLYELFISLRGSIYNQRKYFKSIPTIGSNRFKKQEIGIDEVQTRQFQSIYNDSANSEPLNKIRRVLIYRSEWKRPPMYLIITHKGKHCSGVCPLAKEDHINYDIDTDEEWEEQFGGEDVENVDDSPDACDEDDDNDAVASGWLVPDGCFQSDELLEEFTIVNSTNDDCTGIVNLLPFPSQYQSPFVISFLNHTSIDFGLGISIPSEEHVTSAINSYSIHLTHEFNWIYNRTDASRCCISLDEASNNLVTGSTENSNTKKNTLDLQLKQEFSYFVHGKWSSIRKIIDEFIEINNYKDITKASIIQFARENVRKEKLTGDARSRWYVNENAAHLKLDSGKLSELLTHRRLEEKTSSNKTESTKNGQTRANLLSEINHSDNKQHIQSSWISQNSNSEQKMKWPRSPTTSIGICPEYSASNKTILDNDENINMNSQYSVKSIDGVLNTIPSSQGSYQSSINSQGVEKDTYSGPINNSRKRKFPAPTRDIPLDFAENALFGQEKKSDGLEGLESARLNTPESKRNYSHIHNNSLITHFFPPKDRG
ncbi:hypothetical protein OJ253_3202 [Cryptosporidium canis]|uniref:Chromatin assembly factor 1 subunit A dimerization domain-containing protein n=1 Tax=Cryptosporidium canis TaxID=195482 RepID=A0A9D5HW53_9CRYT|nr:hypothetical protein OJ253_3202 [Cryptosporidium canis]